MRRRRKTHVAVYGKIKLQRGWCQHCLSESLVREGRLICCDKFFTTLPTFHVIVAPPCYQRKYGPSSKIKRAILETQNHKCLYCRQQLVKGFHWDHFTPFALVGTNEDSNWVAACPVCNQLKQSKVFRTKEKAIAYVRSQKRCPYRTEFV